MSGKTKIRSKAKIDVKRKPIKAGHNDSKKVGGVANAKVVAIVRKTKNKK